MINLITCSTKIREQKTLYFLVFASGIIPGFSAFSVEQLSVFLLSRHWSSLIAPRQNHYAKTALGVTADAHGTTVAPQLD